MITQADVEYSEEIIENLSVEQIRDIYSDSLLLWMCGSGSGAGHPNGNFYCVMDYRGNTKFMEGEVFGASVNAAMIEGLRQAVISLKKPIPVLLLTPCPLGFVAGFRGKGPNGEGIQAVLEAMKEKGCTLTTSVITGDLIKQFVMQQGGKVTESRETKYKKVIYRECLGKVCGILQQNGVAPEVIDRVRAVSPDE